MASAPILAPGLYVAATPIGNLGDASRRLGEVLSGADRILCEDTRVSGRLLQALGATTPLGAYHDHNAERVRPGILSALADGARIVLISDAGTPLISDPGYKLVRAARDAGVPVFTVPGPSAVTAALAVAGVPTDRFTFCGFPPAKEGARRRLLEQMQGRPETLVFFETAPRLGRFLGEVAAVLGDRPAVIARELSKLHEEVIEGPASVLAARFGEAPPKGEIVVILPPVAQPAPAADDAAVDALMEEALRRLSLKDAAAEVAARTGLKRRSLYQRWLGRRP